jgi:SAM-dependent methyltransferase
MFSRSAAYYDLIYSSFKDYAAEADRIAALIRERLPAAHSILDIACGTGEHARQLAQRHGFQVEGLELEPTLVEIARTKLPAAAVHEGDMTSFDLRRRYQVVTCLFSSIGYAKNLDNVRRTLTCMRAHTEDGGIIIVEPWFTPAAFRHGNIHVITAEGPDVTVTRMIRSSVEGNISRLEAEYLIGRATGIEHRSELHELGLFTVDEMLACFDAAALHVEYDPEGFIGRGVYIARRKERQT